MSGLTAAKPTRTAARAHWLGPVAALLLLLALLFVAEPMRVGSASMAPTFAPGDQVVVDKLTPRMFRPHRMDVVTAKVPGARQSMLKRVLGVGGDTVAIEDGVLYVNGRLVAEPYVDLRLMDSVYFGPVEVPQGTVFLLGDNRPTSIDSRSFGPVPEADISGLVRLRWWPPRPSPSPSPAHDPPLEVR